jgi:two-component system, chemotaxis family, chemotaxis protein CheY
MKFLIVDDLPTMRRVVKSALIRIGYEDIIEAEDGVDALQKLKDNEIDMILTDWSMPKMDGLDLVKTIRANENKYKNIPILMITVKGNHEDVIEAINAKVNNYIVKPFTPLILQSKIEAILNTTIV